MVVSTAEVGAARALPNLPAWVEILVRRRRPMMNQREASEVLGLANDQVLSRMERGRQPIPDEILAKARELFPDIAG